MTLRRREYAHILQGRTHGCPGRRSSIQHADKRIEQDRYMVGDRPLAAPLVERLRYGRIKPALDNLVPAFGEGTGDPCEISILRILFYLPIG